MIDNSDLQTILATATDISIIAEVYASNATPTDDGFDPVNALGRFAAISGLSFLTYDYDPLVTRFGSIQRSITGEINNTSVSFTNLNAEMSQFEFANSFEGLILVIRLISRSMSTTLAKSQILFVGKCDQPKSGSRDSFSVSAKSVLDSVEVVMPRRKFTKEDMEGRVPSDPEFEGFQFMPQYGTVAYSVRQKRGGILGLFGFKKTVQKTLQYSSYSDLDSNKYVPEIFGRAQIQGVHIGYIDVGVAIRLRTAFCEGEIEDITDARSVDPNFTLSGTSYAELYGLVGDLNGPDDPGWVAPGYYSRTAHIRGQADNSLVEDTDPAPDVVAVILGRKMTVPDSSGDWVDYAWTDNPAAIARFCVTSDDYYKLDEDWIDDGAADVCFNFNAEQIFDTSVNDFVFVEEG